MIPTSGCSLANLIAGADPVGSATQFEHLFLIQVPPPWSRIALSSPHAPPGLREALAELAVARVRAHAMLVDSGTAPPPSGVRLLYFSWPTGLARAYHSAEFVVPADSVADSMKKLASGEGPSTQAIRSPTPARQLFVCTHGERDGCCGRFGEAAYRYLSQHHAGSDLRIWRTSHFGGHRFAPTLLDLPSGRCWGRLSDEACDALVLHSGSPHGLSQHYLSQHYRGWCALPQEAQVAERDLFLEHGWRWLETAAEVTLSEADEPGSKLAHLRFQPDGGRMSARTGRLRRTGEISAPASCGASPSRFSCYECSWVGAEGEAHNLGRTPPEVPGGDFPSF